MRNDEKIFLMFVALFIIVLLCGCSEKQREGDNSTLVNDNNTMLENTKDEEDEKFAQDLYTDYSSGETLYCAWIVTTDNELNFKYTTKEITFVDPINVTVSTCVGWITNPEPENKLYENIETESGTYTCGNGIIEIDCSREGGNKYTLHYSKDDVSKIWIDVTDSETIRFTRTSTSNMEAAENIAVEEGAAAVFDDHSLYVENKEEIFNRIMDSYNSENYIVFSDILQKLIVLSEDTNNTCNEQINGAIDEIEKTYEEIKGTYYGPKYKYYDDEHQCVINIEDNDTMIYDDDLRNTIYSIGCLLQDGQIKKIKAVCNWGETIFTVKKNGCLKCKGKDRSAGVYKKEKYSEKRL